MNEVLSVLFKDHSHSQQKVQSRQHNQTNQPDGHHDILTFFLLVCSSWSDFVLQLDKLNVFFGAFALRNP